MTRRQKKRLAIMFFIVVAVLGGSYFALSAIEVNDYVYGSGYFTTPVRSEVRPTEKHPIKNILVEDGARVEKKQVLIDLEDRDLLSSIEECRVEVRLTEAQLARQEALNKNAEQKHKEALRLARLLLDNAQQEFNRAEKLLNKDAISPEEIDRKKFRFDVARERFQAEENFSPEVMQKDILVLQRKVELARQRLHKVIGELEARRITSPISGVLSLNTLAVGEVVDPARVLGEVFDDSAFEIKVKVGERYLHKVEAGQEASASVAAYPHELFGYFPGTVAGISQIVTPLKAGEGYFIVKVEPAATEDADVSFKPGLSADVRILVGRTSLLNKLLFIN